MSIKKKLAQFTPTFFKNVNFKQADRACGSSAHGQTDSNILLLLCSYIYYVLCTIRRIQIPLREEVGFDGYVSAQTRTLPVWEIFRKLALIPGNVRTYPKVCVGKRLEYR